MTADTAPAAMPGEEDVARAAYEAICGCYGTRPNWDDEPAEVKAVHRAQARAILDLFAPILAERDGWVTHWQTKCQATRTLELAAEARALAAEAALAAERERIATNLDAKADALWERCETKRSNPPSVDEQADAAQAFALQKAAAAIRAQGE
jgi:hypothetical protein